VTPGAAPSLLPLPANQAMLALETGDWRTALELARRLDRMGPAVRSLALSMRDRTYGLVAESWDALAEAAARHPHNQWSGRPTAGPDDQPALPWPAVPDNDVWSRFALIGQREELQARHQRQRVIDAVYPKRACLIEACVDHLTWVFFDRFTWRAEQVNEWCPANDRVTRGRLGEMGREYFLRRANELYHWVHPIRGSLSRKVWDELGGLRGLHGAALAALAEQDPTWASGVAQREARQVALTCARTMR
jgi:hypothetical protein